MEVSFNAFRNKLALAIRYCMGDLRAQETQKGVKVVMSMMTKEMLTESVIMKVDEVGNVDG